MSPFKPKRKNLQKILRAHQKTIIKSGLICGTVIFALLTVISFTTAREANETVISSQEQFQIHYDFEVYPTKSTLYPNPESALDKSVEVIHKNLTRKIELEIIGLVRGQGLETPMNEDLLRITPTVSTATWEKNLEMEIIIEQSDREEGGFAFHQYRGLLEVPFEEAEELVGIISEEIGGRMPEEYAINFHTELIRGEDREGLLGSFAFTISNQFIRYEGERLYEQMLHQEEEQISANKMGLAGFEVGIETARIIFPLFLGLFILGGAIFLGKQRTAGSLTINEALEERNRIDKKYKSRMIGARQGMEFKKEKEKVLLSSFEDLLKVADEREKPVIQSGDLEKTGHLRYIVLDEDTYYYYELESEVD